MIHLVHLYRNEHYSFYNCTPTIIIYTRIFYVPSKINLFCVIIYAIHKSEYSQSWL